jgi:GT2 family glycosyltransferase
MKLLVIIVTYNAMQWAERCFHSLKTSTIIPEIFVIDNGSTDGTQDYIKKNYPEVKLTESESNLGFGKANNIGLQYALDHNYDYVYLLNQDAWVMPDTFEKLINASKKHPEYGILSPLQMKANTEHLDDNFIHHVLFNHQKKKPYLIEDLLFNRKENIYEVSFVMAAHWLITKKCIETVGGFSPIFYHYGEDDNYINRTYYWKMKVGIVPSALAVHDRADSVWSEKKIEYSKEYLLPLIKASNPLSKNSTKKLVASRVKKALVTRNKRILGYAYKLYKERKNIEYYYQISLKTKAFLT